MDFQITDEILTIKPRNTYLSAIELIEQRKQKSEMVGVGVKKVHPQNTKEEVKELDTLYDQLEKYLSMPRIERLEGRAIGYWDNDCNAVCIRRKDGKFDQFGYSCKGQYYLTYYEALFLLELNRLQLEYNSLNVSIEQAYLLLLGEEQSNKFYTYLLYSNLTRAGYLVRKYENIRFNNSNVHTLENCIWATLKAKLGNCEVMDNIRKSSYYHSVQQQFDFNAKAIRDSHNNPQPFDQADESIFSFKLKRNSKRSASTGNWSKIKRKCYSSLLPNDTKHSLVDVLRDDPVYQKFKDIFAKFDIIPLTRPALDDVDNNDDENDHDNEAENDNDANSVDKLEIEFDLYLRSDSFKKAAMRPPNFRIVILKSKRFPNHSEIYELYRQQVHPVPLLLITISESKQLQAFSYYFS